MEQHLEAISSYAADIDNLILLIGVMVGFWFILCEGIFFWLIFRFRAKPGQRTQYISGEEKSHKRWISYPHLLVLVCDVFIIMGAVRVWYDVKQHLPPAGDHVRVIAQQWAWTFVLPGSDGAFDTSDDIITVDELHIKVNTVYHYHLEARDVLHSFSVPVFRLKQDAVPGRVITGWFDANKTGSWDIQCAEICGIGHAMMAARLHVESDEEHAAWLADQSPTKVAAITHR